MSSIINFLCRVNPWKTIYFNFHYFPIKIAVRLPFLIHWRTKLYKCGGGIIIDAPVKMGMVRLGPHYLGIKDSFYSRTIWDNLGTMVVKGKAHVGRGTKISIHKNAVLTLGQDFTVTGNTEIICDKKVSFGNDCLISWDVLIMDTDTHPVLFEGNVTNESKSITIGNHVWIGCRVVILKNVSIASDTIVSASSLLSRSIEEAGCVVGGHGKTACIIKRGVTWGH